MYTNPYNRREFLKLTSRGVGALTLSSLINSVSASSGYVPKLHHAPKAKSVIFLYMSGGVSHVDSFDPKPLLRELHGQPMPMELDRTQFDQVGNIMGSFWGHKKYGKSGIEMTNLFPNIAELADEMTIVRSLTAKFSEHAQGNFFMHSGFPFLGYPSAGAWVNYGLGTENKNLPGYVVLQTENSGSPHGGVSIFGNAFLPATNGGSIFNVSGSKAVPNIEPTLLKHEQRKALDIIKELDYGFAERTAAKDAVMSSVQNAETAYLMQESVPELTDISKESDTTLESYGVNDPVWYKSEYAKQCLMARRLIERGVRFVELSCCPFDKGVQKANPWDQHNKIEIGHGAMASQVDKPIAALLQDLKQRGLLDDTLVVFTGEFGRNPFAQNIGRDHNPQGFSAWLSGGGVKGGHVYGATDEFGYRAVEEISNIYELWATVLHLLGVDHYKLTYRYSGRDLRLTDVHGKVWKDIIA
ncbi:MAG: DUF1501 domain-containing protein [Opitutaceae bacterium]|nr:DUF1501 domain-containing protein [Opitutaceae bacterium]